MIGANQTGPIKLLNPGTIYKFPEMVEMVAKDEIFDTYSDGTFKINACAYHYNRFVNAYFSNCVKSCVKILTKYCMFSSKTCN